jgi:glycosyltransferase involved in cell wall biosynthesis
VTPPSPAPLSPLVNPLPPASLAGLRVLALCEFLPSESCGGSDQVVWQVYRRLAAWGAEVTVVSCAPPGRQPVDEVVEGVRLIGATSRDLARFLRVEATVSWPLVGEVFRAADRMKPAVIHANSLHFQSTVVGSLLHRRRGIPLVTTAHIGSLRHIGTPIRVAVALYERSVGRFVLSSSSRVIAVSPSVGEHLLRLGVPESKIAVVPNGVDHGEFRPAQPRPSGPAPRVAFIGRIIANKGPALFVEALAGLVDRGIGFDALIVGDGPSRHQVEQDVAQRGLSGRVTFTGHVRNVADILRAVDVLVRPSMTEGMPLAVLEAMASGVCVVASDVDGTTDLIDHERNGLLFPVGRADALTDRLARVLLDAPLRRRLAEAGLATAATHSWDACSASTAEVLIASAGRA